MTFRTAVPFATARQAENMRNKVAESAGQERKNFQLDECFFSLGREVGDLQFLVQKTFVQLLYFTNILLKGVYSVSYETYKTFEKSVLNDDFDPRVSAVLLEKTKPDAVIETVRDLMHNANINPQVDRAVLARRLFSTLDEFQLANRLSRPVLIKLILSYSPVLALEEVQALVGPGGRYAFDIDELNLLPEGAYSRAAASLQINARYAINAQSVGHLARQFWEWFEFQDALVSQATRCTNPDIVGDLIGHEPFALAIRKLHLKTEVLQDARVLAHVVTHKAYKSSDSFRVLSAGMKSSSVDLFQASLESVTGWSKAEGASHIPHSTASVMMVLLDKEFRNAEGDLARRVEMAKSVLTEICSNSRKGFERHLPSIGLAS